MSTLCLTNYLLSAVHRKLAMPVSFCMRKVDFPALCGKISRVRKIGTNLLFSCNSAKKSTFRTQNDTDLSKLRYTANNRNRSYYVQKVF